ncbi:response regulator [Sulfurimonas lithotrophica]|uniref:Response regulator n=1 Tax=Sulfurimonas lithotrophica TaxID=2590022 RepID=A0A5P8P2Y3_9BACT|nr:HD domain-containing phosphohydrolase [Sulfurimonas lithotrophica]QFR50092.1 response regulator [Sulfurimonas lithotrophica]
MDNLKTILIIDDAEININVLMELLDDKYDILASLDAKDGLEILKEEKVDLILLDIIMPEIDGFEVCKRLKSDPDTKDIPVIFITASTDEDSIERAYDVGAVDYITKPFKAKEVLSRINTHLALSEQKIILEKDLEENKILLNQYKEVVDISAIVSKTDLKGRITYVNKAFTEISGYSKEELIGKNHNIIRHPDVSKNIFKDMWKTIQSKHVWQGEVKNLKKDGGYYVVQSVVMPILDTKGDIEEYISVRYDITDTYDLQKEIEHTQKEVVFTMGAIGETRSKETGNHVKRVAEYSRALAKHLGLSKEIVDLIADASPMHDIGKVAIHDNILHKPSKLTDDEFAIMRTHAELGHKMLAHSDRPLLRVAARIALEHHERWDGNGYPRHLKGEDISLEGRITAIADVFDALGSDRVYKQAWDDKKIFEYFKKQRSKQFDPKLVDIFFDNLNEFLEIRETFKDV